MVNTFKFIKNPTIILL